MDIQKKKNITEEVYCVEDINLIWLGNDLLYFKFEENTLYNRALWQGFENISQMLNEMRKFNAFLYRNKDKTI